MANSPAQNTVAEDTETLEERKRKEIEWSDFRRTLTKEEDGDDFDKYTANLKYYCIIDKQTEDIKKWLLANTRDKDVFEMACGNTAMLPLVAKYVKSAVAADIAPVTIELAKNAAKGDPDLEKIDYRVMDCEKTGMPDNSFDVILEQGALHHMDLDAAYSEAARLLRPNGKFFCLEAIRHNPIIHLYRKMTPHLRTEWEAEHILGHSQVMKGLEYFNKIDKKHYFLFSIFAVPFRNTFMFKPLLAVLGGVDAVISRIPGVRWLCWQCLFVLSEPKDKK
ncbi:MAG: class I SAM-dependent methyltransferase [Rickettsiales bacterium]